jgi:hypothetical protein
VVTVMTVAGILIAVSVTSLKSATIIRAGLVPRTIETINTKDRPITLANRGILMVLFLVDDASAIEVLPHNS